MKRASHVLYSQEVIDDGPDFTSRPVGVCGNIRARSTEVTQLSSARWIESIFLFSSWRWISTFRSCFAFPFFRRHRQPTKLKIVFKIFRQKFSSLLLMTFRAKSNLICSVLELCSVEEFFDGIWALNACTVVSENIFKMKNDWNSCLVPILNMLIESFD